MNHQTYENVLQEKKRQGICRKIEMHIYWFVGFGVFFVYFLHLLRNNQMINTWTQVWKKKISAVSLR